MKFLDTIDEDQLYKKETVKVKKVEQREIAIIGIGGTLPMAEQIDEFWENLEQGISLAGKIPRKRKQDVEAYMAYRNGETTQLDFERAAYLEHIDEFDYRFFNLSKREAELMDPNQKIALQTAWKAVEDAGYSIEHLKGSNTGVYTGFSGKGDYLDMIQTIDKDALQMATTGNLSSVIGGRISYVMDLKGPNYMVNTMCSSSLVAVHCAVQALRNGECKMALAGGIQLHVLPLRLTRIGIESSDNLTKTFDEESDGTGGGEGCIYFLLKPLSQAQKDGDNIYAVIKGTAINQDGRTIGISAPNPEAQAKVIKKAWEDAQVSPESISYVEAHGSGTKLGDPIEIEGMTRAFSEGTLRKQFCGTGSVKSNLGHLDACAGAAGMLKAVLALKHKKIPATLHFQRPNQKIKFYQSPVYVNSSTREWIQEDGKRRCGVSSFGFSGTNCHVVLEEYETSQTTDKLDYYLLTLSAKSEEALKQYIQKYREFLNKNKEVSLPDLCYVASTGREQYSYRLAILFQHGLELQDRLDKICFSAAGFGQMEIPGVFYGRHVCVFEGKEEREPYEVTEEDVKKWGERLEQLIVNYGKEECPKRDELVEIAKLYVKGARADWNPMFRPGSRKRIALPTYPFQRTRCWISVPSTKRKAKERTEPYYYQSSWRITEGEIGQRNPMQGRKILLYSRKSRLADDIEETVRNLGNEVGRYDIEEMESQQALQADMIICMPDSREEADVVANPYEPCQKFYKFFSELEQKVSHMVEVVLVTSQAYEVTGRETVLCPEHAMLTSLVYSLAIEQPLVLSRVIDRDGSVNGEVLGKELLQPFTKQTVAFRDETRFVQILKELQTIQQEELNLQSTGVYLFTGTTGGLAIEAAKALARQKKINLAFVSRTRLPEREEWNQILIQAEDQDRIRIITGITQIEKLGSKVDYYAADLLEENQVADMIAYLTGKYRWIRGVVHCVAIGTGLTGVPLKDYEPEVFQKVMEPKVMGTMLLDRYTDGQPLDFIVSFSSPITLMGGYGAASYAAGNVFLNTYAAKRRKEGRAGVKIMSWAPWADNFTRRKLVYDAHVHMFEPLTSEEVQDTFLKVLGSNLNEAIIGKLNLQADLLEAQELLPFQLDSRILASKEKKDSAVTSLEEAVANKKVVLTGKASGDYSDYEKEVGNVLATILDLDSLDLYDNFFELGGDSIIAMKIVNFLNQKYNLGLKAFHLLQNPYVIQFAGIMEQLQKECAEKPLEKRQYKGTEEQEFYPLSSAQRRIYLLSQEYADSLTYNMTEAIEIEGRLSIGALQHAIAKLIGRHDGFRTVFEMRNGIPVQRICDKTDFELPILQDENSSYEELIKEFAKPFDLTKCAYRTQLVCMGPERYLFLIDMHHIISDGISKGLLLTELAKLYNGSELEPLKLQYKDYAQWEANWRNREAEPFQKAECFFQKMMEGKIPELNLPVREDASWEDKEAGNDRSFYFGKALSRQIIACAKEEGISTFVFLFSAYAVLLEKYTGQQDIIIGTAFAGREDRELERIMGVFLNLQPIRCYPKEELSFKEFLRQMNQTLLEVSQYQFYPIEDTISSICSGTGKPLYDTMFLMQNTGEKELSLNGLKTKVIPFKNHTSKMKLLMEAEYEKEQFCLNVEYATNVFTEELVTELIQDYIEIVTELLIKLDTPIQAIARKEPDRRTEQIELDMDFDFD